MSGPNTAPPGAPIVLASMAKAVTGRLEIRFGGSGGLGLQLSARILATAAMLDGRQVAQSQHYEPTSRGGLSRSDVVIDSQLIDYPLVVGLDALVVLDEVAVAPSLSLLRPLAPVIADAARVGALPDGIAASSLPLIAAARDLGNPRGANIVALGALAALVPLGGRDCFEEAIRQEMPRRLQEINLKALAVGYDLAMPAAEVRSA